MKTIQPLTISFLLHACLALLSLLAPDLSLMRENQEIEIVYQNETNSRRQLVSETQTTKLKEALEHLKDKAKYLSEVTKRVKKEVVNRNNYNSPAASQFSRSTEQPQNIEAQARLELQSPDEPSPSITRPLSTVGQNARLGDSSLSDYVPEVRSGGFSALNTDQFIHYTFYARINEQVKNRWIANIREFINKTPQTEINRLAQKTQISQVEIVISKEGRFIKSIIHQQSENRRLEESAIFAFRLAAPFFNPPAEMIGPDGNIHLHYGFHIHFTPRYLASGTR